MAILATDGFEQAELTEPRRALDAAGADTQVVSPKDGKVRGWKMKDWGDEVKVDQTLDGADPRNYDALLLPGGVINADALRMQPKAVKFVKSFFEAGKPVGVICHAALGVDRIRSRQRSPHDLLALAQDRSNQCRRAMGR